MSHTPATQAPTTAPEPRSKRTKWVTLGLLAVAQFILILDITVVNVALPTIATDLAIGRESLTWVVTAYVLAFGGLMLLGGRLADLLGRRNTLFGGLILFTLASLVAGLAGDAPVLISARVAQGVGAALLSPAALSILTTMFHGTDRNRALGIWAALGGSGAAAGVLLSGILTSGPGWQWVFFINVPIGVALVIAMAVLIPAYPRQPSAGRPDIAGALIVTTATASLVYGLVQAGDAGWSNAGTVLPIAVAGGLYLMFVLIERSVRNPLMRLTLFRQRPVISGTLVMLTASATMLALFFLGSLYLQHVLGFSALRTGLLFLPVAIAITVGAHLASRLVGTIGGRPVVAAAFVITAVGTAMLTRLTPDSNAYVEFLPWFGVAAFGIGPAFVVATTTTLANVVPHEAGLASGVINTFHEVGGAIGVAVVSTVAAASIGSGLPTAAGFTDAFLVLAVIAAVVAVASPLLVPPGKVVGGGVGHGH